MDRLHDTVEIGEGTANVTAEISFDQLTPALTRATSGGTSGTAINDMTSICVLLYKVDGSVLTDDKGKPLKYYFSNVQTEIVDHNKPSDMGGADWVQTDATSTVNASIKLTNVPYGKYHIYAIANVPESEFSEEVITDIDKVKSLHFAWNKQDIAANCQMFGYFSDDNSSKGFDAPLIAIKQPNQTLHAWVKRLTSKVTVAFDGSNLYDDVNIYLISSTIKDIPANCYLGQDNSPGSYTPADNEMNKLISSGETIMYVDEPEGTPYDKNWPAIVSNNNPVYGFNTFALNDASRTWAQKLEAQHGESVNALYFFENMQGTGTPGLASDKWQVVEGSTDSTKPSYPNGNTIPDGTDDTDPAITGYKDNKIHGTYVEVKAYYISNNPNDISQGEITYRFMIGKDTHTDFNAERNHHYKVTLYFKGYANDVDWHIDYDQDPEIVGTTPNYISYLYNQQMDYSFTVVGGELLELTAEIPNNEITQGSWHPMASQVKNENPADVYWTGPVYDPGPWNGFLSLRKTTVNEYNPPEGATIIYGFNKEVFYGRASDGAEQYNLGYREYVKDGNIVEINSDYSIDETSPGTWKVTVPMYTRPRVMVATTGYTGNNPYVAYNRQSQVIFSAKVRKNGIDYNLKDTIDLLQARRIVNPKAVWREANSVKPFHVQLKIRESQMGRNFINLLSYGPWKAEVILGDDWIDLDPTPGASERREDGHIYGSGNQYASDNAAGRTIDFTIKPKGTTSSPRGGIIRIYYNNYSCVHNIFVRQGYEPVQFYNEGPMWHTCNLRVGDDWSSRLTAQEVEKPQYEGSYFRQKNRIQPIDASSNTAPSPFVLVNGMDKLFNIAGLDGTIKFTETWEGINGGTLSYGDGWWGNFNVKLDNKTVVCRMPRTSDINAIISNPNTIFGYGIIYGDEAEDTQEKVENAYEASPENPSYYGMRGVIVCDESTGNQIFFPIAASGFGRFKQYSPITVFDRLPGGWGGVVQYSSRYALFPEDQSDPAQNVIYKPLFYDIYTSQGTLYWLNWGSVIDINYLTLGFRVSSAEDAKVTFKTDADPSGTDALHIRLVHDKN